VVRKALVILLVLPFLLPPGFCLCQLGTLLPGKAEWTDPSAAAAQDAPPCRACGCGCGQSHCQPEETVASSSGHNSLAAPLQSPCQDSDQHTPGCPAHPASVVTRASTLVNLIQFADLCDAGLALQWSPLCASCSGGVLPAVDATPYAPSAPLFVFCCAFRC